MIVETPTCIVCRRTAILEVDTDGWYRWTKLGEYIQDAMPNLTPDQRELLLSGTHAQCWATIWPEEDDHDT